MVKGLVCSSGRGLQEQSHKRCRNARKRSSDTSLAMVHWYSKIYHYGQKDISFSQISKILEIYLAFSRYISRKIYLPWQFSAKRYIFQRYISLKIYISQRYNYGTQFPEIYLYCTKDISFSRKIISPMLCTSHNIFSSGFVFKFTFKNYSVAKIPSERHVLSKMIPCIRSAFHFF